MTNAAATNLPLPTCSVTIGELKPVWLSEDAQGWHVTGSIKHHTSSIVENWGAAVDDVGNPLAKRWISMTKGYATREDEVAILAEIERAIIMSGA